MWNLLSQYLSVAVLGVALQDPAAIKSINYCDPDAVASVLGATPTAVQHMLQTYPPAQPKQRIARGLVIAGLEIAAQADSQRQCEDWIKDAEKTLHKLRKQSRRRVDHDLNLHPSKEFAALQQQLHALWLSDQVARLIYLQTRHYPETGSAYWQKQIGISDVQLSDLAGIAFLQQLLQRDGWVDRNVYGNKTSSQAWLLAQHADSAPEIQQQVLARMQPLLDNNRVKRANYAYLWDRVAINAGRKQRYGTQPIWECDDQGQLTLHPVEDPESLDQRRREMQMGPAQSDLAQMSAQFCGSVIP